MSNDYETIGDLLNSLSGHGVYDVALIEDQFGKFGFTYDRTTQRLSYANQSVNASTALRAATPKQTERDMRRDPRGGILDEGVAEDSLLVDALAISVAVFQLLMPNVRPRSELFVGRGKGFRANVDAIRAFEKTQH